MRTTILIAALFLASCGGGDAADNAAVSEEASAEKIGAVNDATAIDAATGEAANMAADVNYTFNEEGVNETAGNAGSNAASNATTNNSL